MYSQISCQNRFGARQPKMCVSARLGTAEEPALLWVMALSHLRFEPNSSMSAHFVSASLYVTCPRLPTRVGEWP